MQKERIVVFYDIFIIYYIVDIACLLYENLFRTLQRTPYASIRRDMWGMWPSRAPVHGTATYRCDDTRGCIIQF